MITTRIIRASALVATVLPCVVAAQTTVPKPDDATMHVRLGGGVLTGGGPVGLVGFDWQPVHSRFSIRATADYSQHKLEYSNISPITGLPVRAQDCSGFCVDRVTRSLGGISLDAKYDLLTGRFRPYVFSGFGLYRASEKQFANAECRDSEFTCTMTPGEVHAFSQRSLIKSLHSGVGASLRVRGRIELFGEASWRALSNRYQAQDWNGPLTIGLRF